MHYVFVACGYMSGIRSFKDVALIVDAGMSLALLSLGEACTHSVP